MSRTRKSASDVAKAAVLCDFVHDGKPVKAGTIFEGDQAVIEQYAASGVLDPHPVAVAHLEKQV